MTLRAWLFFLLLLNFAQAAEPIKIGAEDDWFPYSGQIEGKPVGFSVDLVRAAFRAANQSVTLVSLPYARCMELVRQNKLQGCFNTLRTEVLATQYKWHQVPLFRARIAIYGRSDHIPRTLGLNDLYGKRIGVTHGYEYGGAFDADANFQRDIGNADIDAIRKLVAGRVHYALLYDKVALSLLQRNPTLKNRIKDLGTLHEGELYIALAPQLPSSDAVAKTIDQGLQQLQSSGEYQRIEARWR